MNGAISFAILLLLTLTATAQTITLKWTKSPTEGVTNYILWYGTNSGNYEWSTNSNGATEQVIALPFKARWYFAVQATDGVDVSDYSNEHTFCLKTVIAGSLIVR